MRPVDNFESASRIDAGFGEKVESDSTSVFDGFSNSTRSLLTRKWLSNFSYNCTESAETFSVAAASLCEGAEISVC